MDTNDNEMFTEDQYNDNLTSNPDLDNLKDINVENLDTEK